MTHLLLILFWTVPSYNTRTSVPFLKFDSIPNSTESLVISKTLSLPEVKRKGVFIDSLTHHKHGITILILKRPTKSQNYYWVQVGYNNELRFEPYYNFYVYRPKLVIKYFDPMSEKISDLSDWRKSIIPHL